jgi:hypothetical protein
VVEGAALEKRCAGNGTEGSNPSLSAKSVNILYMSAGIISLLFSVGAGTWVYTKFQRTTGNNTKTSVIAAVVAGLMIFFVMYSVLNMILK